MTCKYVKNHVCVSVCVCELTHEHCAFEGQRVMSMDAHYLILFIQVLSLNLEGPYQLNSLTRNPGIGLFCPLNTQWLQMYHIQPFILVLATWVEVFMLFYFLPHILYPPDCLQKTMVCVCAWTRVSIIYMLLHICVNTYVCGWVSGYLCEYVWRIKVDACKVSVNFMILFLLTANTLLCKCIFTHFPYLLLTLVISRLFQISGYYE